MKSDVFKELKKLKVVLLDLNTCITEDFTEPKRIQQLTEIVKAKCGTE
jgi:hypothetical protein